MFFSKHFSILSHWTMAISLLGLLTFVLPPVMASPNPASYPAPSSYDTGLGLKHAVKTTTKPLLIEFYADWCGTCRKVTPLVKHMTETMSNQVGFVMVNAEDPSNRELVKLFGIYQYPSFFLYDVEQQQFIPLAYEDTLIPSRFEKIVQTYQPHPKTQTCLGHKCPTTH